MCFRTLRLEPGTLRIWQGLYSIFDEKRSTENRLYSTKCYKLWTRYTDFLFNCLHPCCIVALAVWFSIQWYYFFGFFIYFTIWSWRLSIVDVMFLITWAGDFGVAAQLTRTMSKRNTVPKFFSFSFLLGRILNFQHLIYCKHSNVIKCSASLQLCVAVWIYVHKCWTLLIIYLCSTSRGSFW